VAKGLCIFFFFDLDLTLLPPCFLGGPGGNTGFSAVLHCITLKPSSRLEYFFRRLFSFFSFILQPLSTAVRAFPSPQPILSHCAAAIRTRFSRCTHPRTSLLPKSLNFQPNFSSVSIAHIRFQAAAQKMIFIFRANHVFQNVPDRRVNKRINRDPFSQFRSPYFTAPAQSVWPAAI